MFEKVVAAPADPILGLTEAFRADSRSHKINLGVGIYKDETGATPILHCVKKAEQKLLTDEKTKNYLGIEGNIEHGRIVQQLLFDRIPLWSTAAAPRRRKPRVVPEPCALPPSSWYATTSPRPSGSPIPPGPTTSACSRPQV